MSDYAELARFRAAWLWWSVREFIRELWRDIPGPLPVKIAIMAIIVACLFIPGPFDEILVIGGIKLWRGHQARTKTEKLTATRQLAGRE